MKITQAGRLLGATSAVVLAAAATAAALTGGFGLLGVGTSSDPVRPDPSTTGLVQVAPAEVLSGEPVGEPESPVQPESALDPTPTTSIRQTEIGQTASQPIAPVEPIVQAAAPAAAKPPTISWVNNRNGTYTISWANMNQPFSVYIDGVLVASLNKSPWVFTAPRAGAYAISVTDAKGASAGTTLKASGLLMQGSNDHGQLETSSWYDVVDVATGLYHTVGLTSGGTVRATGDNTFGQCETGLWTGITDVEAGWSHTLGLRSDGTVAAAGRNDYRQTDVGGWTSIVRLAAGTSFSVGLRSDGSVVATGRNQYGQLDVTDWAGIVDIASGSVHTLGLKSDGTVVYAGPKAGEGGMLNLGQDAVDGWSGIAPGDLAAGHAQSLAVSGGTVLGCGSNASGQFDGVETWTDIVAVDGGIGNTVGLKSDGTAVVAGAWWDEAATTYTTFDVSTWTGLDAVSAQGDFIVGLVE